MRRDHRARTGSFRLPSGGNGRRLALQLGKLTLTLVLLAAIAFAGYFGYRAAVTSAYFVVDQVVFEGVERATPEELQRLIGWVRGYSIFRLPMKRAKREIEVHPWVASADLARELPGTLRVQLTEHKPRAAVLLGHLYLVDGAGEVFKRASMDELEGLAVITGIQRLDYLNRDPKVALQLARALTALRSYMQNAARPPLSEINVGDPGAVALYLRQGGAVIRAGRELTERKLGQLDSVLAALGPDVRRARAFYLDHEQATNRVVVRMASYD